MQILIDAIHKAEADRLEEDRQKEIAYQEALAAVEAAKQTAYAETVAKIMESIGPDLVAAMNSRSNADMTVAISEAMAPYALAKGESVAEVVNKLLRGTTLEDVVSGVNIETKAEIARI